MILVASVIFALVFGGVKMVSGLKVDGLETLTKQIGFSAGISAVVILIISFIIVLF